MVVLDQSAKINSLLNGVQATDPRLYDLLKYIVDNLQAVYDKVIPIGSPLSALQIDTGNDSIQSASLSVMLKHRGVLVNRLQVTAEGDLLVSPVGRLDVAAVAGFLTLGKMSGAPTGAPPNIPGNAQIIYDTTNKKIWVWDGSTATWKGVVVV